MDISGYPQLDHPATIYPASDTVDLRSVLAKAWARKRFILLAIICGGLAAFAVGKLMTPVYRAEAYIMIQPQELAQTPILEIGAPQPVVAGPETVENERFVLASRGLAVRTIERLHLERDPEINPALRREGLFGKLFAPVRQFLQQVADMALQGDTGKSAASPPASAADDQAIGTAVVDNFLRRLKVSAEERSSILQVEFSSAHPLTAALVPNTLAELYIETLRDTKQKTLGKEADWLERVIAEWRGKLHDSETALAEYRRKTGLTVAHDPALLSQQLTAIDSQLAAARARRFELSSSLGRATGSGSSGQLSAREAELQGRIAAAQTALGPNNPKMLELTAELAQVRAGVTRANGEAAARRRGEAAAAQATESALARQAGQYTEALARVNGGDVQLLTLTREEDATRKTYEQYLALANRVHSLAGYQQAGASIVSRAAVPPKPAFPNRTIILIVGLTAGAGGGIVLAFMIDSLMGGLRNREQVESLLGVKCLGQIPKLAHSRRLPLHADALRKAIAPLQPAEPAALFSQALHGIKLKLVVAADRGHSQTVLVTAALPREGKTSFAVGLAMSLAADGQSVAIVDCDPSRPTVHRMFGGVRGPGLKDYLAGRAEFAAIVHHDDNSGVDYVPAGNGDPHDTRRPTAGSMQPLIDWLKTAHAFVILDSAPVLAASETTLLARLADRTIFLVRWGTTPAAVARHALTELLQTEGVEAAAVLSMMDLRRAASYGDEIAGMYRQIGKYYYGGQGLGD